ncbi:flagellin biosynthesis protein FlgM [Candidatus Magnetomorum sp. HK-1]|nr:flagellin biosynthesis protein FlgM [Candidatus Magnetomorum sp. HK-1]
MTDITPPPGLPMAGYSALSSDSKGFRTRLKARAFYFKPAVGSPLVIVQCDLLSASRILHHSVSERIAKKTDISASGLVIYGSHTHSGPGNFFSSEFYNGNASNRSGFDPQLFEFLSSQIATAIINAYNNSKPALLSTGVTKVHFATRNRSLKAYIQNKNISSPKKLSRFEAVNPLLYMIRVDILSKNGDYQPSGAISFFSIHPNISPQNLECLYSGDIIAYIERYLENVISERYDPELIPVHAVVNMTHGDNNPNLPEDRPENFLSAKKLGNRIGKKAVDLFEDLSQTLKREIRISFRAQDIDVLNQYKINNVSICQQPVIGFSVLGGAKGKGSLLQYIPPFAPGWPKKWFTDSCQGSKRKVLGPFHSYFFPKYHYPHYLLTQLIQVDNLLLLPLPFEICYESGKRMADHVYAEAKRMGLPHVKYVVPSSCANGYWGYVTTKEEYQMQYYEGGHTLYGPNTRKYLSEIHSHLLSTLIKDGNGGKLMDACQYEMKSKSFYPESQNCQKARKEKSAPIYIKDSIEPYWSFQWIGSHPSQIDFHLPLIRISHKKNNEAWKPLKIGNIPVDDQGYDIAVILLNSYTDSGCASYEVRWYHPQKDPESLYRFEVLPRNKMNILYSSVFTGE